MRVTTTAIAIGPSPWAVVDSLAKVMNALLNISPDTGTTFTGKVEYTPDKPNRTPIGVFITRSGAVATVNHPTHGLSSGDATVIMGSGDPNLDGQQPVITVLDVDNYTYPCGNTGLTKGAASSKDITMRVLPHDTLTAVNGRASGTLGYPVQAVRLNLSAFAGARVELTINQGIARN